MISFSQANPRESESEVCRQQEWRPGPGIMQWARPQCGGPETYRPLRTAANCYRVRTLSMGEGARTWVVRDYDKTATCNMAGPRFLCCWNAN